MTDIKLIDALAVRLREMFKGYVLLNKSGVLQEVQVFTQYLPQPEGLAVDDREKSGLKSYGSSDYEANFPSIIIRHEGHIDHEERRLDQSRTEIKLLIGIFDERPETEGWRDILSIVDRIRKEFLVNRVLAERYLLNMPLEYKLLDADTWPVYFGEMSLKFDTGREIMGRDFVTKGAARL